MLGYRADKLLLQRQDTSNNNSSHYQELNTETQKVNKKERRKGIQMVMKRKEAENRDEREGMM